MFIWNRYHLDRWVVACVVITTLLALTRIYVVSHNPVAVVELEQQRHTALMVQVGEAPVHGHSHDDGTSDEQQSLHQHGHTPIDHTHEIAVPIHYGKVLRHSRSGWSSAPPQFLHGLFHAPLERPPKPIIIV